MHHADSAESTEPLSTVEQRDQPGLEEHFRHSNSPGFLSPSIDHFVGDLVQLYPPEIVNTIFAYCEPEDIFKCRNVSRAWNSYLSRPEFLQIMKLKMYMQGGQYLLNSNETRTESQRTFEDRVRNRRALINGRARRFEYIGLPRSKARFLEYNSGTIIGWSSSYTIYVKRLYRGDAEWDVLKPAASSDTSWDNVKLTSKYILANTFYGQVSCWSVATLDLLATFWVAEEPELVHGSKLSEPGHCYIGAPRGKMYQPLMVDATSDAIVIVCQRGWFLYSLGTRNLARVTKHVPAHRNDYQYRVDQSGYLYIYLGRRFRNQQRVNIYKINDTSSSIDCVSCIDLYTIGRQHLASIACDRNMGAVEGSVNTAEVVVVWNHECFCLTSHGKSGNKLYLVFELKDGLMTFHHSIQHEKFKPITAIFHPQLHQSFIFSKMPHQIRDKIYRPVVSDYNKRAQTCDLSKDVWKGDINYLVSMPKESDYRIRKDIKVWRFCGPEEDLTAKE